MLLAWQLNFPPSRWCVAGAGYVSLPFFCRQTSAPIQELSSVHSLSLRHQDPLHMAHLLVREKSRVGLVLSRCPELLWAQSSGQQLSMWNPWEGQESAFYLFSLRRKINNAVGTVCFGAYIVVQSVTRALGSSSSCRGLSAGSPAVHRYQLRADKHRTGQAQGKHRAIPPHSLQRASQGLPEPQAAAWALRFKKPHVLAVNSDYCIYETSSKLFGFHNWSIVFASLPPMVVWEGGAEWAFSRQLQPEISGVAGGEPWEDRVLFKLHVPLPKLKISLEMPWIQMQNTTPVHCGSPDFSLFMTGRGCFLVLKERQAWVLSCWNNLAWTVWVLDDLFSWPFGQDRVKYLYIPLLLRSLSLLLQEWWLMSWANLSVLWLLNCRRTQRGGMH